jgi:hypothetical protein
LLTRTLHGFRAFCQPHCTGLAESVTELQYG